MPIVLLEAAACACPCVVSDIPEHLEVVRAGERIHALTFRVGDVEDLTSALERAAAGEAKPYGEALQDVVLDSYRWASIAGCTEAVYREASGVHSASR